MGFANQVKWNRIFMYIAIPTNEKNLCTCVAIHIYTYSTVACLMKSIRTTNVGTYILTDTLLLLMLLLL